MMKKALIAYSVLLSLVLAAVGLPQVSLATDFTAATGQLCTIVGDDSPNSLVGTAGDDVICGLGGNDVIDGLGGNDVIDGGFGADTLLGRAGNDTLIGGPGNDTLNAGAGTDTASYVDVTDTNKSLQVSLRVTTAQSTGNGSDAIANTENLTGGSGADTLTGNSLANVISGGGGDDFIRGGDGADTVTGGGGDDGMIGGGGTDNLDGEDGENLCDGTFQGDVVNNCGFDEAGPRVVDYTTNVTSVNTSVAAQTITFRIHVTDDLMGAKYVSCDLYNGPLTGTGGGDMATLISGNSLDGVWECQTSIPRLGAQGKWYINLSTQDNTDSVNYYGTMTESGQEYAFSKQCEADALGGSVNQSWRCATAVGPMYISQTGRGDNAPPALVAVSSSKTSVNTSANAVNLTIKASMTDDVSGIKWVSCDLIHPDGMLIWSQSGPTWTPSLGNAMSGIYTCNLTMPRGAAPGIWTVRITAEDKTKKQTYYDTSTKITQTGAGDSEPPVALSMTPSKTTVNTSLQARTITFALNLKDDYTGIPTDGNHVMAYLTHDSTNIWPAPVPMSLNCSKYSFTGQCKEGVWTVTFTLPKGSARGEWAFNLEIRDVSERHQVLYYDAARSQYYPDMMKSPQTYLAPVIITNG